MLVSNAFSPMIALEVAKAIWSCDVCVSVLVNPMNCINIALIRKKADVS